MALPTSHRIKKRADFDRVFQKGRACGGVFLLLRVLPKEALPSRVGITVSAKIAPRAVDRNRLKRVVMDTVGTLLDSVKEPRDIIIHIKKKGPEDALRAELQELFNRFL